NTVLTSTLFPYTTLFRSRRRVRVCRSCVVPVARHPSDLGRAEAGETEAFQCSASTPIVRLVHDPCQRDHRFDGPRVQTEMASGRSEEHTSELQSRDNLVC